MNDDGFFSWLAVFALGVWTEALALCDLARAKRTEPTKEQQTRAREHWHGPRVLDRLALAFKREQRQ